MPIRTEHRAAHGCHVTAEGAHRLAAHRIPQPRRAIATTSQGIAPIRTERYTIYPIRVTAEGVHSLTAHRIPHPSRIIPAGGEGVVPVWTERHTHDSAGVTAERKFRARGVQRFEQRGVGLGAVLCFQTVNPKQNSGVCVSVCAGEYAACQ